MDTVGQIRAIIGETLQLGERAALLDASTPLLGSLPELDSMAVATLIIAIEERFDISVEDDISAEVFETLGTLAEFVDQKLAE